MIERGTITPNFHLRVSLTIVYFLGTWPPVIGKFRLPYLLYTICSFTFILGILLSSEIANVLMNWGDMSKLTAVMTLLMTNCTHASKVVVLLRRQARIQTLLDTADSPAFSRYDKEYEDLLISYTWKGIFHHAIYQSFGGIAVFCWGFTPIADFVAGRSRQLPMEGWYPYNTTATPAFEITAAHQGIAIIIACFHNVAMDTLMTGLITVACCQLAILERNIISIDNKASIHGMQNDNDKNKPLERKTLAYQLLKRCAMHSNMIFQ
ncbi:OR46A protein, partial [Acromyrmex charruanus]